MGRSEDITTLLCSVQHSTDVGPGDFQRIIESIMGLTAAQLGVNTDFEKQVNPTVALFWVTHLLTGVTVP